ncbi:RICIN domain-containing protein [Candidatus Sumerlaeota bacterium]|nr:RICIN domain-containing protein [Candidatus Sumerlaeota bacterium]
MMKRLIELVVVVSCVCLLMTEIAQAQTGSNMTVTNRKAGKVLDAFGSTAGSNVGIYTDYGNSNQRWTIAANGSGYTFREQKANLAMDTWNWGTANGTNIAVYTYWGGSPQTYLLTAVGDYYRITPSISTGQCVDAYGTSSGSNVGTWSYWGGTNQQWSIEAPYEGSTDCGSGWSIGYPWGRTHNGTVYMAWCGDTMVAVQPGANGYKYNSGASYSTTKLYMWSGDSSAGAQAYCSAPTATGTWPAFWITTEGAWTGEVDIAEWKGSGTVWQNTYDGSWETKTTSSNNTYYKVHMQLKSTADGETDAWVWLYINGSWTATHTGSDFRNKNFWLIRNLQMEGSSGSPGPTSASYTCRSISQW